MQWNSLTSHKNHFFPTYNASYFSSSNVNIYHQKQVSLCELFIQSRKWPNYLMGAIYNKVNLFHGLLETKRKHSLLEHFTCYILMEDYTTKNIFEWKSLIIKYHCQVNHSCFKKNYILLLCLKNISSS